MLSVDIQKLLKNGESRYELVAATAKRARMIVDEVVKAKEDKNRNRPLDRNADKNSDPIIIEKPVSIAVKELNDDKWAIVKKNG